MTMRLVFAGTPEVAVPALSRLVSSRHEVVAVLTRPDARSGRGRRVSRSPVAQFADTEGIPVLQFPTLRDDSVVHRLAELRPDVCPVVAFGSLVPAPCLAVPPYGWVNLHFSLLPSWRGAAPVQHAIWHGDDLTGATTFRLEEGLDTGPVFGTMTEPIRPSDTAGELLDRLSRSGAELLLATIDAIESGAAAPVPQSGEGVSLAPKITTADAQVRWRAPALAVDRQIRACTPAPGAWSTFRDLRVKLGPVSRVPSGEDPALAPGILASGGRDRWLVGTGSGAVVLGDVQPPGKRSMPAADWLRGLRPTAAEAFGAAPSED